MAQVITNAFITYLRDCKVNGEPVVLDEIVLADIPGLDPDVPIDPATALPAASRIVHRHPVDQRGRINADAVTYSIVMDTTIGDFDFNAMYLINRPLGIVGMIVHKGTERKVASSIDTGKTGNSIVKSMVMSYRGAASATVTTVDASTWQIDYAARLRGMDDDLRLQALRAFGPASFQGDSFNVVNDHGTFKVLPGVAFIGGLRAQLDEVKTISVGSRPSGLWLDIHRAGSLLDAWVNHVTLRVSALELTDHIDANGYQHYVAKLAIINADGSLIDTRSRRELHLTGGVQGSAFLDGNGDVTVSVQVMDDGHEHTISTIKGLQSALDSKAQVGHTHSPSESGAAPTVHGHTVSDIFGLQADLDDKSPVGHTHSPSESGAAPTVHGHVVSDVFGLQADLDSKSPIGHTHTPGESNAAPAVHNHLAQHALHELMNSSPGFVGSLALLENITDTAVYPGSTLAGSNLQYASTIHSIMHSPVGTWRCLGTSLGATSNPRPLGSITMWIRIV